MILRFFTYLIVTVYISLILSSFKVDRHIFLLINYWINELDFVCIMVQVFCLIFVEKNIFVHYILHIQKDFVCLFGSLFLFVRLLGFWFIRPISLQDSYSINLYLFYLHTFITFSILC